MSDLKILGVIIITLFSILMITQTPELIPEASASHLNTTDVLHRLQTFDFAGIEVQQINKTTGANIGSPVALTYVDPILSTYNSTWQYREHNRGGSDSGLLWMLDCNRVSADSRCEEPSISSDGGLGMQDLLDTTGLPAIEAVGSDWYFFKTFESPDPLFWDDIRMSFGVETRTENATADTTLLNSTLRIYDGAYDRRSSTDFPDGSPIPLKGNGLLHTCDFRQGTHNIAFLLCRQPDAGTFIPFFNSTTGFITMMFKREQCDLCGGYTRIEEIEIRDVMKWDFEFGANTINREVEGTTGDYGTVDANAFTIDDSTEGRFDVEFTRGLAIDPTTNLMYGLFKMRANSFDIKNTALGLINHVTGTVNHIRILHASLAGLAFDHDGELRAVCDSECERLTAPSPAPFVFDQQDYFAINKTTGELTQLCNTGLTGTISNRGYTLGEDFDSETMILSGGNRFFGQPAIVRSIDNESTCALSTITISGHGVSFGEEDNTALTWHTGDDLFYGMFGENADSFDFFTQNTTGFRTQIAFDPFSGDEQRGLGFFFDIGDVVPAVLTLVGDDPTDVDQFTVYVDDGATCLDNFDGVCTGSIVTVNPVDTSTAGQYIVTYDHQDSSGNDADQLTRTVNVIDKEAPVITIIGDLVIEVPQGGIYVDQGATATDNVDGDVTSSIITTNPVDTSIVDAYFVSYVVTDSNGNTGNESRTVIVVSPVTGGGITSGAGEIGDPFTVEEFTQEQLAFQQSLEDALSRIADTEASPLEAIIQTFFEFTVIDKEHDDVALQSFIPDQRLGFRWSSSDDLVLVSAIPAESPFSFTFEQLPAVKRGSGAVVSTNFVTYDLEVPREFCSDVITENCVQRARYEVPVTLNVVIEGIQVSDTGTITVDLTEELLDPILLILLATFSIPLIATIVQRARNRSDAVEFVRRGF